jgi:hypothetical protein
MGKVMGEQSGRGSVKGVSRGSLGNGEQDAKDWGKAGNGLRVGTAGEKG